MEAKLFSQMLELFDDLRAGKIEKDDWPYVIHLTILGALFTNKIHLLADLHREFFLKHFGEMLN